MEDPKPPVPLKPLGELIANVEDETWRISDNLTTPEAKFPSEKIAWSRVREVREEVCKTMYEMLVNDSRTAFTIEHSELLLNRIRDFAVIIARLRQENRLNEANNYRVKIFKAIEGYAKLSREDFETEQRIYEDWIQRKDETPNSCRNDEQKICS